jgi:hypothetical protein
MPTRSSITWSAALGGLVPAAAVLLLLLIGPRLGFDAWPGARGGNGGGALELPAAPAAGPPASAPSLGTPGALGVVPTRVGALPRLVVRAVVPAPARRRRAVARPVAPAPAAPAPAVAAAPAIAAAAPPVVAAKAPAEAKRTGSHAPAPTTHGAGHPVAHGDGGHGAKQGNGAVHGNGSAPKPAAAQETAAIPVDQALSAPVVGWPRGNADPPGHAKRLAGAPGPDQAEGHGNGLVARAAGGRR